MVRRDPGSRAAAVRRRLVESLHARVAARAAARAQRQHPTRTRDRRRALIAQLDPRHHEVVLGLLPLLRQRYERVDLIAHPALAPVLAARWREEAGTARFLDGFAQTRAVARELVAGPHLVLLTSLTFARADRFGPLLDEHPRAIGIVHFLVRLLGPRPFGRTDVAGRMAEAGRLLALLTSDELDPAIRPRIIQPIPAPDPAPDRTGDPAGTTAADPGSAPHGPRLAVVGSYGTDLRMLVRSLDEALAAGMPTVPVDLVGRWTRAEIDRAVAGTGVEHLLHVVIDEGRTVDQQRVDDVVRRAAFLVKAKPAERQVGRRSTGLVGLMLGSLTPMIVDERLARSWRLPGDTCVTFADDRLADGLVRALAMPPEGRAELVRGIARHRAAVERANLALLDELIARR